MVFQTFRTLLIVSLSLTAAVLIAQPVVAQAPVVNSADLVAHFVADPTYLDLDASNNVIRWTSTNDPTIQLDAGGTANPENIVYDPSGLGGEGTLVVRDYAGQNRYLRGDLGYTSNLTDTTIFWLGNYHPGAGGSLGDAAGQYAYSLGSAGSQGSQMDHQIDDGAFELYGGSGTQTGDTISYLNGFNTVYRSDYYSGSPGHVAYANGVELGVANDSGYNVPVGQDLQLFGWQNSSGVAAGYNFVGDFSEMLIYQGRIDDNDATAVHNYLSNKLDQTPPSLPETKVTFQVNVSGQNTANDNVPDGFYAHGNPGLAGTGTFTFDTSNNTMDWSIKLDNNAANKYVVTQAHFYNINRKPNGDSIFCWGGRWSNHDFLEDTGFSVSSTNIQSIIDNPQEWVLVLHTEGGHFATDANGNLIEYDPVTHETSETGQDEVGARFNNRVGRKLTDLLLREQNPNSGTFGSASFDAVYPDINHFDRENDIPFADALGNLWIAWDATRGRYVPTAYGAGKGLTEFEIDNTEFLFYRYDDQGPSWDYGGPEGAAGGALQLIPEPSTVAMLSLMSLTLLRRRTS